MCLYSLTKLEIRAEQFLPGSERVREERKGLWGREGIKGRGKK
jgi:hypothetical protein